MQMKKSLEGKVVLVTGAGRGIGREVALLAASEGASVIVNDLGVSAEGEGSNISPAHEVVKEIEVAGGKAVANTGNITNPIDTSTMIQQSIETFGDLHCVINNAGFLRDRIFHKMSNHDWQAVVEVHLTGYFNVSKAAAQHFREKGRGSFVHFTSTSGLIGNLGQANYSAAKMGVVGLSKSIALDMAKFNVRSNCIAPFAWSRLIETIATDSPKDKLRADRMKEMTAAKIAPLAVFLAGDMASQVNGQIFAVRKNEIFLFSQPRPIRSTHCSDGWNPQTLAEVMIPSFKSSFVSLDVSSDIFCWDAI